jgi:hypothetical protein
MATDRLMGDTEASLGSQGVNRRHVPNDSAAAYGYASYIPRNSPENGLPAAERKVGDIAQL